MKNLNNTIIDAAGAQGFAMVGFAAIRRLAQREDFYRQWLDDGRHGAMGYLAREPERRFDPRVLDPRFKSVVSLAYPYHSPSAPKHDWRAELRGRIAAYALGPDYHDVVLKKARVVADVFAKLHEGSMTRAYVDTGPVFEREWAAEARIGWFGKNTTILSREHGSYFFLAEIFTDLELEPTRAPYREHCGTCTRCLDLCPTNALADRYLMEPRLCISYLTIENRGPIPHELRPKLGNWIFGCDICQEVCPWNELSSDNIDSELTPFMPDLMALDDAGFSGRFSKSAIKRAKRRGLLRNVAVALGNSGNREAVPVLARTMELEPEAIVRSHAAWALGALGGPLAKRALERARKTETDSEVREEVDSALSTVAR
ncbi:MAG TPA: tRNA epoxyqueuosine(34) reductase QueG [Candidatus Binataceae bacterium]|nr:tRNA epoxyqueuosine(34) reductase QueG [Candidatus Binataceae bacterium]